MVTLRRSRKRKNQRAFRAPAPPSCAVCGNHDLQIDSVEALELCECPRCLHRFTRLVGTRALALRASDVRKRELGVETGASISDAA